MNLRIISTAGYLIVVVAAVMLIPVQALFAEGPVAIAVQVVAALLMIWARWTLGWRSFHLDAKPTEGGLVTTGPYRYLRHPVYAAVLYFVWAGVFSHLSVAPVTLGALLTGGLFIRMLTEEKMVSERYPEYAAYAARTRRIVPFLL
jgi:protein-S-isoprenylcysteine O-methyltransferase Ste14